MCRIVVVLCSFFWMQDAYIYIDKKTSPLINRTHLIKKEGMENKSDAAPSLGFSLLDPVSGDQGADASTGAISMPSMPSISPLDAFNFGSGAPPVIPNAVTHTDTDTKTDGKQAGPVGLAGFGFSGGSLSILNASRVFLATDD